MGQAVTGLDASPDGQFLASSGHGDDGVRIWDLNSGALIHHFVGHTSLVFSICFSPDGHSLLSGSHDKTFRLWSLDDLSVSTLCLADTHCTTWSIFTPDGQAVLSYGGLPTNRNNPSSPIDDTSLHLWDISASVASSEPGEATADP